MSLRRLACCWCVVSISLAACSASPSAPSASVRFVLNAPFCSSVLAMRFAIDGAPVGADTFRVNLANPRTASRRFVVAPGNHALGARVDGGVIWPDASVMLAAGTVFDDSLPMYCS